MVEVLYEDNETASIKYIGLISNSNERYDLALIFSEHFYGKMLFLNIQSGKTVIAAKEDLADSALLDDLGIKEEDKEDFIDYINGLY